MNRFFRIPGFMECSLKLQRIKGPQKIQEKKLIERRIWMPSIFLRDYVPLDLHKRELKEKDEKIDQLNKSLGALLYQLKVSNEQVVELKMVLGFRTEIEEMELFLWPCNKGMKTNRKEVWEDILKSQDPAFANDLRIIEFRDNLKSENVSVDNFIKNVLKFHERTFALGHIIIFPRSEVTQTTIKNVLNVIGLPDDNVYLSSIKILLTPLKN